MCIRDSYVGDTFERIAFREIDGSEIVLGKTSKGKQLTPYGLTDMGREVELTNVTYSVKDSAVAAVTGEMCIRDRGLHAAVLQPKEVTVNALFINNQRFRFV